MARFSRMQVYSTTKQIGMVPIFYHHDIDIAKNIINACIDGGAKVIEFTNRGDGAIDVFRLLTEYCRENNLDIILGVGSVIDAPTAALYIAAGADFIVSPILDKESAIICNARKIAYMPGCSTLGEINKAHRLGVEVCKLFPGDANGGPGFIKAIRGPMPWTDIMVTGGVSLEEENLKGWFDAGAVCVGIGSKLITKQLIESNDYQSLANNIRKVISVISKYL